MKAHVEEAQLSSVKKEGMERSEKRGNGRRVIVGRGMVKRSEEKGNGGRSFRREKDETRGRWGGERGREVEERRGLQGRGPGLGAREERARSMNSLLYWSLASHSARSWSNDPARITTLRALVAHGLSSLRPPSKR